MYALEAQQNLLHHSACARNLGPGGSPQHSLLPGLHFFSHSLLFPGFIWLCLDVVVVPPPNNHRRRFPARRSRSAKRSYGKRPQGDESLGETTPSSSSLERTAAGGHRERREIPFEAALRHPDPVSGAFCGTNGRTKKEGPRDKQNQIEQQGELSKRM